jgi:ElaB/YqjD/DUF883 family membrane-anchored ribosome-binding protein
MTTRDLQRDIDALRKDLSNTQHDLQRLARSGGASARRASGDAMENVRNKARDVYEDGSEYVRSALPAVKEKGREVVDVAKAQIEERPFATVLVTLGLGLALGLLLSRRGD